MWLLTEHKLQHFKPVTTMHFAAFQHRLLHLIISLKWSARKSLPLRRNLQSSPHQLVAGWRALKQVSSWKVPFWNVVIKAINICILRKDFMFKVLLGIWGCILIMPIYGRWNSKDFFRACVCKFSPWFLTKGSREKRCVEKKIMTTSWIKLNIPSILTYFGFVAK